MLLTRDNYYSPEADQEYFSCSQYQAFCECEAKAMAKIQGRWQDEPTEALLVGNYFHTYFEGPEAHEQYCNEHFDAIYKTKTKTTKAEGTVITGKKATFAKADEMIATAENDELIRSLIDMQGESEAIMTGKLFGVPWRVRLDKYVAAGRLIIDWKTCASISELRWSSADREKVSFIRANGYMMRAAVYAEIEKQNANANTDPNFLIVAISKQDPPDKDVFMLNHRQAWDLELEEIKERLPLFQRVKEGRVKPKRCGVCDYCRATKKLYAVKPYYVLDHEFREAREDDDIPDTGALLADAQAAPAVEQLPAMPCAPQVGTA